MLITLHGIERLYGYILSLDRNLIFMFMHAARYGYITVIFMNMIQKVVGLSVYSLSHFHNIILLDGIATFNLLYGYSHSQLYIAIAMYALITLLS